MCGAVLASLGCHKGIPKGGCLEAGLLSSDDAYGWGYGILLPGQYPRRGADLQHACCHVMMHVCVGLF